MKKSRKIDYYNNINPVPGCVFVVSAVFAIVFYVSEIPLYLAFVFGGIALATAPAPALSIVREFNTDGPVTKTLIPMAALDDMVGCVVFFTTISIVAGQLSSGDLPAYMIALIVVLLPLLIGAAVGVIAGFVLKKDRGTAITLLMLGALILIASGVGFIFNTMVLPSPVLNFMLIGMAFSAVFANMVSEKRLGQIMTAFNPILGLSMVVVILNLGAPLDYHLILGAGLFTVIYIVSRAAGKYLELILAPGPQGHRKLYKNFWDLRCCPFRCVSGIYRDCSIGSDASRLCGDYSGNHCRRRCD